MNIMLLSSKVTLAQLQAKCQKSFQLLNLGKFGEEASLADLIYTVNTYFTGSAS